MSLQNIQDTLANLETAYLQSSANLIAFEAAMAAIEADQLANPKPSYTETSEEGSVSIDWNSWRNSMNAQRDSMVKALNDLLNQIKAARQLINQIKPWMFKTVHYV